MRKGLIILRLRNQLLLFLAVLMLLPGQIHAASANEKAYNEEAMYYVQVLDALDILSIDSYMPDEQISRGEFASLMVQMLHMDVLLETEVAAPVFLDVPADGAYKDAIAAVAALGLMVGDSNGRFLPDNRITYAEAVKVLVCAVGYDVVAQQRGGYPAGFLAVGANTKITRGMSLNYDADLSKAAAARLIYQAMEVDILSARYSGQLGYELNEGSTLMSNKLDKLQLTVRKGIVTANTTIGFDSGAKLHEDEIRIDGQRYLCGGRDYDDLLGCAVEAYISTEGAETIKSVFRQRYGNAELIIDAEDIDEFRLTHITYDTEEDDKETAALDSEVVFIYNGRPVSEIMADDIRPEAGTVRLLSHDAGSTYRVVLIEDSRSYVVGRVAVTNAIIHFKEFLGRSVSFRGKPAIYLNNSDPDYHYVITDAEGEPVLLSDIQENDVVTLTVSKDETYIKIQVVRSNVTGILQEIKEDEIMVNDTVYPLNLHNGYQPLLDIRAGDNATFYLDAHGKVIMSEKITGGSLAYAYVVDAKPTGGALDPTLSLKLMHPGSIEKVVDKNDSTKISYTLKNGEMKVLPLAETVKVDGAKVKDTAALNLKGCLLSYRTNSEGEIDKIELGEEYNRDLGYRFNSKLMSFGGQLEGGFLINEQCAVICVPRSGNVDDYYQQVRLIEANSYDVLGYDVDSVTCMAKAAVITANMSASGGSAINNTSDVAVVKQLLFAVREDGTECYKVSLLDDTTEKLIECNDNDTVTAVVARLKTGDLINYTQDAFGRMNGIKILAQPTQYTTPLLINERQTNEEVYGYVYDIVGNTFHSMNNEMVDRVTVVYDESGLRKEYVIPRENTPPLYVYRRANQSVKNIASDDFVSYRIAGGEASTIFMAVCEDVVRAVLILE